MHLPAAFCLFSAINNLLLKSKVYLLALLVLKNRDALSTRHGENGPQKATVEIKISEMSLFFFIESKTKYHITGIRNVWEGLGVWSMSSLSAV